MTIAPGPAKLIRKGKLGISVWVEILLHKYAFGIPFARHSPAGPDLVSGDSGRWFENHPTFV